MFTSHPKFQQRTICVGHPSIFLARCVPCKVMEMLHVFVTVDSGQVAKLTIIPTHTQFDRKSGLEVDVFL